jgi:hypothetical protein
MICTKYYSGDQFKRNEIGGTCSMYVGEERCMQVLVGKSDFKRSLRRLGVYWRIILKQMFKKWDGEHGLNLYGCG